MGRRDTPRMLRSGVKFGRGDVAMGYVDVARGGVDVARYVACGSQLGYVELLYRRIRECQIHLAYLLR